MILSQRTSNPPRLAIVTCSVLELEMEWFRQGLSHVVRMETLEQGLHNEPDRLRVELQKAIDRMECDGAVNAIALGYGLCCRGTEGVKSARCRLVIARAHDCITHLLGSKERYAAYVAEHPGTYWYSPGWNQHHLAPGKERYEQLYRDYLEKYGEDNAKFLMESEQHWFTAYRRAAYVDLGVGDTARELAYTRQCAEWLGWSCDHQRGDPSLLKALLAGDWDDARFLVLNPGEMFRMTADERIIEKVSSHVPIPAP